MSGLLTHSPADIVRYALVSLGLGVLPPATGWPIYVGQEPPSPDEVLTLYDTTGRDQGRVMYSGERQTMEGIQVRARSRTHVSGWTKLQAVAIALDKDIYDATVTIGAATYLLHSVSRTGNVLAPGKENLVSELSIFTVNALVSVRQRTA